MINIKEKTYELVSNLSIPIQDNPETKNNRKMPYGLLKTINVINTAMKNYQKANWLLRIDIFSNYKGEKEISDYYYNEFLPVVKTLQELEEVTQITPTLDIEDDKETGPVTKHGIITLNVETMEV